MGWGKCAMSNRKIALVSMAKPCALQHLFVWSGIVLKSWTLHLPDQWELVLLQYKASGQAWPETVLHSCPRTKKSHNAAGFKIYHSSGTSQFQFQGLYSEKLLKCAETDRMFIIEVNPLTGLVPSSDCTNTPVFSKSSCSQKRAIALENRDFKGCEIPAQLLWSFILGERTGTWY